MQHSLCNMTAWHIVSLQNISIPPPQMVMGMSKGRWGGGGGKGDLKMPKFPKDRRCRSEIIFPQGLRQNSQ